MATQEYLLSASQKGSYAVAIAPLLVGARCKSRRLLQRAHFRDAIIAHDTFGPQIVVRSVVKDLAVMLCM